VGTFYDHLGRIVRSSFYDGRRIDESPGPQAPHLTRKGDRVREDIGGRYRAVHLVKIGILPGDLGIHHAIRGAECYIGRGGEVDIIFGRFL
jgi:hypothetical protein